MRSGRSLPQADQQLRGGLRVGQRAMVGLDLDLEEAGQVAQLQVRVRVCLAGQDQRVEVAARLDMLAALERGLDEADVEADVVSDEQCICPPSRGTSLRHRVATGRP